MDKLINHLNDQIEKINLTTSEIGLSHELKEDKIKSFMEAIEQFASDQCALVEKEKQDIIKATENTHRSILSYKRLMGEYVANTAIIDPNKSLKDNLQEMQQELIQVKEVNTLSFYFSSLLIDTIMIRNIMKSCYTYKVRISNEIQANRFN